MAKKPKFYVVWQGRRPGVYSTWDQCQTEINGFAGAKYKSFASRSEAEKAYKQDADDHWGKGGSGKKSKSTPKVDREDLPGMGVDMSAWAVDAACKGNPGELEYQGVDLQSNTDLFHMGPYPEGTVNIGEFLAIVHALALLHGGEQFDTPIYSDSRIGMSWVKQGVCKTKLPRTGNNRKLFNLVDRAERWLAEHGVRNPVLKWETKRWGEIPADFGRK
ncbi:ribonuclease HI [Neorhodopirellula lusitana]|uniref:Ribonuclease H n=1 Tax=Neorhodopirellula lusitana TaxID=445327 RepID=A0ABY1PNU8_9BACT|nr:ribonuclease H family protein [Neorhodopirellula lusitana]SMP40217.1 ribonuclease HI [Neorhodopirellula lusitana]